MKIEEVIINETNDIEGLVMKIEDAGFAVGTIVPRPTGGEPAAATIADAAQWIRSSKVTMPGKGIVAMRVMKVKDPPCQSKGADSASPQPANRVLRGRPSDAVDVADPKIRTKSKEMLTATESSTTMWLAGIASHLSQAISSAPTLLKPIMTTHCTPTWQLPSDLWSNISPESWTTSSGHRN